MTFRAAHPKSSPPASHPEAGRAVLGARRGRSAFTLIELILVMALLTVIVSLTAPRMSRFFQGRTLDSEARRLLALTRSGQNRAVSEGVPMDLWVNTEEGTYGLEAERIYETEDPKAIDLSLDSSLRLETVSRVAVAPTVTMSRSRLVNSTASVPRVNLVHANLPTIRFLPDGSISESSPQKLHLVSNDGTALWLIQTRDALGYDISSSDKQSDTAAR
jgi:prepilin-type N-terminal cleavage/methylation domain-containing protein